MRLSGREKKKKGNLRKRFIYHIRRTSPKLVLRLIGAILLYSPWLLFSFFVSVVKARKWQNLKTCRAFIGRHKREFGDVEPDTLQIETKFGGVSNFNQIWRCRKSSGESALFFVKIFVEVGSFWAKHLSLVSPFPRIYSHATHERFTVSLATGIQLSNAGIPVPALVAYDAVEKMMVIQHLEGISVDEVLKRIAEKKMFTGDEKEIVGLCGRTLAHIHKAGFSLIDTQPVNCIWVETERKVYFTDLEFSTREDKRVWDVGFFLCFVAVRLPLGMRKEVRTHFLESYRSSAAIQLPEVTEVRKQLREYLHIFQTILDIREHSFDELFSEMIGSA